MITGVIKSEDDVMDHQIFYTLIILVHSIAYTTYHEGFEAEEFCSTLILVNDFISHTLH